MKPPVSVEDVPYRPERCQTDRPEQKQRVDMAASPTHLISGSVSKRVHHLKSRQHGITLHWFPTSQPALDLWSRAAWAHRQAIIGRVPKRSMEDALRISAQVKH